MERINNKELNSHDLAREIEIVKLQEENKRLNGAIQTYDILLKSNIKANEELKSQLRGTTHCFDEEEHNKLKEEITNLSKEIDMWNAKYNDMFDENKRLKEALEAKSYCKYANKCDELDDCSREEYENMVNANVRLKVENCDLKEENQELKKYLKVPETCNLKTLEDYKSYYEDTTREQILEDTYIEYCAYVNLAHRYSKLKKQLENKYEKVGTLTGELLYEENTKLINQQKEFIEWLENESKDIYEEGSCDTIEEILQKYREIIGVSNENTIK